MSDGMFGPPKPPPPFKGRPARQFVHVPYSCMTPKQDLGPNVPGGAGWSTCLELFPRFRGLTAGQNGAKEDRSKLKARTGPSHFRPTYEP